MQSKVITTEENLQKAFAIRKEVFVHEQGVPLEEEFDSFDTLNGPCEHILVYYDGKPVGTGRLRVMDGYGKLERICILEHYRKFGIGKGIIEALEKIAAQRDWPALNYMGRRRPRAFIINWAILLHLLYLWKPESRMF